MKGHGERRRACDNLETSGQQVGFDELGEFVGCAGCLRAVPPVPVVGLGRREGEGACPFKPAHVTDDAEAVGQFWFEQSPWMRARNVDGQA